MKDSINQIL